VLVVDATSVAAPNAISARTSDSAAITLTPTQADSAGSLDTLAKRRSACWRWKISLVYSRWTRCTRHSAHSVTAKRADSASAATTASVGRTTTAQAQPSRKSRSTSATSANLRLNFRLIWCSMRC